MTRAIAVASAVGLLLAGVPAASDAQTTTVTGFDADVEGGPVSGLALSMAPHAQMVLRGEAFESLDRGLGASVALSAYFAER